MCDPVWLPGETYDEAVARNARLEAAHQHRLHIMGLAFARRIRQRERRDLLKQIGLFLLLYWPLWLPLSLHWWFG